jgi:uncharacterized membrane protein (UPF0127 family)
MHLEATAQTTTLKRRSGLFFLFLAGLWATSCSQSAPPPEAPVQPPPTVAKVALPSAVLPDGFVVDLELAVTPQEVADGLMYRPSLPENRGMLFIFGADRYPSFWMKNTLISLDLIFLDSSGSVVDVVADVPPCAADPCPTYSPKNPARAVLELAAGSATGHGVESGVVISFQRIPGYPVVPTEAPEGTSGS